MSVTARVSIDLPDELNMTVTSFSDGASILVTTRARSLDTSLFLAPNEARLIAAALLKQADLADGVAVRSAA